MNPQTLAIGINLLLSCGFIVFFSGLMLGYAIGWRQRRRQPAPEAGGSYFLGGPVDLDQLPALRETAEERVRRSQA
ncbi:hypothetical protein ABID65_003294 [Bradyrhizobium sp. S3.9.2]|uniref:hypothetical protein n=1 Tax=Bradyrhizobium sp. S3.9.2 TaxID=3156432 RepID=UPI0033962AAC